MSPLVLVNRVFSFEVHGWDFLANDERVDPYQRRLASITA
jgi:hypothetical protein